MLRAAAGNEAGDLDLARRSGERALEIFLNRGDELAAVVSLGTLAETELRARRPAAAASRQLQSLDLALAFGLIREIPSALIVAARVARDVTDWATATILQLVADQLLNEVGLELLPTDRQASDELLQTAQARLGQDDYAQVVATAGSISVESAVATCREVLRVTSGA